MRRLPLLALLSGAIAFGCVNTTPESALSPMGHVGSGSGSAPDTAAPIQRDCSQDFSQGPQNYQPTSALDEAAVRSSYERAMSAYETAEVRGDPGSAEFIGAFAPMFRTKLQAEIVSRAERHEGVRVSSVRSQRMLHDLVYVAQSHVACLATCELDDHEVFRIDDHSVLNDRHTVAAWEVAMINEGGKWIVRGRRRATANRTDGRLCADSSQ